MIASSPTVEQRSGAPASSSLYEAAYLTFRDSSLNEWLRQVTA
jgi:hypothetical protein